MFALVDVLMFRTPEHLVAPDRIVRVDGAESYVRYDTLRERARSLELAAYTRTSVGSRQAPKQCRSGLNVSPGHTFRCWG
jgi:hypothetical protein